VRELLRLGFYLTLERKGVKDTESVCVLRDWVIGDFSFHFFFYFFFLFMGGNAESVRVADSVKIDQLSIAVKVKQTSS